MPSDPNPLNKIGEENVTAFVYLHCEGVGAFGGSEQMTAKGMTTHAKAKVMMNSDADDINFPSVGEMDKEDAVTDMDRLKEGDDKGDVAISGFNRR
ncbi:hypothetical protein L1887_09851 [Cichorium endivia]|nr:hypothetical protein L1887_09851 [Cichorium endivia]